MTFSIKRKNPRQILKEKNDNTYCGLSWLWFVMVSASCYYLMTTKGAILGVRHDLIFLFLNASFTFFSSFFFSHSHHSEHIVLITYKWFSHVQILNVININGPFAEKKKIRKQLLNEVPYALPVVCVALLVVQHVKFGYLSCKCYLKEKSVHIFLCEKCFSIWCLSILELKRCYFKLR